MATEYKVDFTDQNVNRSFSIAPYTTNGPKDGPTSSDLATRATSAATSLILYGKGSPDYGERIQENIIHVMENFAGEQEPLFPIPGQKWYDRSQIPSQMRVFAPLIHQIVSPSTTQFVFDAEGDPNDLAARLSSLPRIRIFDATGNQEDYLIVGSPSVNLGSPGTVTVGIFPEAPASRENDWYLGDWEYLLQNNVPLKKDWSINAGSPLTWTIKNVPSPVDAFDVANKAYVDSALGGVNEIGELLDVASTATTSPAPNEILLFTGGLWTNVLPSSTPFVLLSGSTMTGTLVLNADPANPLEAATKNYVDTQIGGTVQTLNELSDVTTTGSPPFLSTLDVLQYNGTKWVNKPLPDFITDSGIVNITSNQTIIGDKDFTGFNTVPTPTFVVGGSPDVSLQIANKDYVDTRVDAISLSGDGVLDAVFYDKTLSQFQYVRTNLLPSLFSTITTNFDGPFSANPPGLAFERMLYNENYPFTTLASLMSNINEHLGRIIPPKQRLVFQPDVGSPIGTRVNLDSSTTVASQLNPSPTAGSTVRPYTVASNRLCVYVNGSKYYASEAGYREVRAENQDLFEGELTELAVGSPPTLYSFQISVNGQAAVEINIDGSTVPRIGDLVNAINTIADTNYFEPERTTLGTGNTQYAFGVVAYDGAIVFTSALPGTGSSVDLTDGGTNNPLFASLGGLGSPSSYTIVLPLSNGAVNPYTPQDRGYNEVGRPGQESFLFEFVDVPSASSTIEIIIDPDVFGERLIT